MLNLKELNLENQDIAFFTNFYDENEFNKFLCILIQDIQSNTDYQNIITLNITSEDLNFNQKINDLSNLIMSQNFEPFNLVINYIEDEFLSEEELIQIFNFINRIKIQSRINLYFICNISDFNIYKDTLINSLWSFSNVLFFKYEKILHLNFDKKIRVIDVKNNLFGDFVAIDSFFNHSKIGQYMSFQTHDQFLILNKYLVNDTAYLISQYLIIFYAISSFENLLENISRAYLNLRIDKAFFIQTSKIFYNHPLFNFIFYRYQEFLTKFIENYDFTEKDVSDMCFFDLFDVVLKFDKKIWEKHLLDGSFIHDKESLPQNIGKVFLYIEDENVIVGSIEYFEEVTEDEDINEPSVNVFETPYFLSKPIFVNNNKHYFLKNDLELLGNLNSQILI